VSCIFLAERAASVYKDIFGLDEEERPSLVQEFHQTMVLIRQQEAGMREIGPFLRLLKADCTELPRATRFLKYALTLMPGQCDCERIFSRLNIPGIRSSVHVTNLTQQLAVANSDLPSEAVARVWWQGKKRRERESKPKSKETATDVWFRMDLDVQRMSLVDEVLKVTSSYRRDEISYVVNKRIQFGDDYPGRAADIRWDAKKFGHPALKLEDVQVILRAAGFKKVGENHETKRDPD
jgi:hypothetical protein